MTSDRMTLQEFLEFCSENKLVLASLDGLRLDEKLLESQGIVPDKNGFFSKNQWTDFYVRFSENGAKLKKPDINADPRVKNLHNFLNRINKIDFGGTPDIKRFLILTLSNNFDADVAGFRNKFQIPKKGFETIWQYEEWHKRISSNFSSKKMEILFASSTVFKDNKRLSTSFKHDLYQKITSAAQIIFQKYKIAQLDSEMKYTYLFFGLNTPELSGFGTAFSVQGFETVSMYTPKWHLDLCGDVWGGGQRTPYQRGDCFSIRLEFPKGVMRKKDLQSFVDKNFKMIKEEFDEYIKKSHDGTDTAFALHWFLCFLNKRLGYKPKMVRDWIRKNLQKTITEKNFKQVAQRMKKRALAIDR